MAGIIRSARIIGRSQQPQGVAFNLEDMSGRVDTVVQQMRNQAEQVLNRANAQADQIRQQAAQKGQKEAQQQAQQAAREEAQKQYQALLPSLREAVRSIAQAKETWQQHWEEQALRLAIAIAERILRQQLPQRPELPLQLMRETLELVAGSDQIIVHLHPDDYELLQEQVDQLATELSRLAPAQVKADPAVQPGGCRVETRFGAIDQQLETQLSRIEQELLGQA